MTELQEWEEQQQASLMKKLYGLKSQRLYDPKRERILKWRKRSTQKGIRRWAIGKNRWYALKGGRTLRRTVKNAMRNGDYDLTRKIKWTYVPD